MVPDCISYCTARNTKTRQPHSKYPNKVVLESDPRRSQYILAYPVLDACILAYPVLDSCPPSGPGTIWPRLGCLGLWLFLNHGCCLMVLDYISVYAKPVVQFLADDDELVALGLVVVAHGAAESETQEENGSNIPKRRNLKRNCASVVTFLCP